MTLCVAYDQVVGATAEMYLNGTLYSSVETDTRHPHDEVMVYLSDGWYEEAKVCDLSVLVKVAG
jgi:hypothetical protein